ncbi:Flap endonuclease 1 [Mycena chlorophos]|uniref:Flap endonuclease 1 n=1 Tax=Mycena chlorophos TaxID=658473 RepID=A0A8H6TGL0_MYCCL|nr:Flap endonuclease 1 [Mycena chlorophos]
MSHHSYSYAQPPYQQPYDPRQYPQSHFQPPYPQSQPQHQYYAQPPPPTQPPYPYPPPQHPQYAPPPPSQRPRSSLGHVHSHSLGGYVNPPPIAPSAWQAQAMQTAQAQIQAQPPVQPRQPGGRPLPAPRRADTLPPAPTNSRPLPTPTSSVIPRSPGQRHSLDLGRDQVPRPRSPSPEKAPAETESQIRRRASPPRFTGGSGSWTDVPPRPAQPPEPTSPAVTVSKASGFKDLLSGPAPQLEGGKFVPLWKRALITNGNTPAPTNSRPLPTPSKTPAVPAAPAEPAAPSGGLKRGGSLHIRSPASTKAEKSPTPSPEPSDDESESESDAETRTSVTDSRPDDSESEEESASETEDHVVSPVSPSGIRDLPRPPSMDARASTSALPQPPVMRSAAFEGRSAPGMMENTGSSRTLMFAAAGLPSSNGKPSGWPAGIPPLPRTPGNSSIRRDVGDLEDSPPVSNMRRGPSSSSASGISGLPGSPLKSPSFNPAPASRPPIPTFTITGAAPPPPKPPIPTFTVSGPSPAVPTISLPDDKPPPAVPTINLPGDDNDGPSISVEEVDTKPRQPPQIFEVPGISVASGVPSQGSRALPPNPPNVRQLRGIACGGCNKYIVGRIVNAMGLRWHPECFRCCVCSENLELVSSYERDGRPYCHLDYHENFAPRCFSCKTPIVDESFISLDDPELGKRTYHEQHFFCSECGDPFLPPSQPRAKGELAFSGDGAFMSDDVGFTVYKGYPYCEACHVRLRLPKCKKCKKSILDDAVEAMGGRFCFSCFTCAGCEKPFSTPAFFERNGSPWCEPCFSIILRNEV